MFAACGLYLLTRDGTLYIPDTGSAVTPAVPTTPNASPFSVTLPEINVSSVGGYNDSVPTESAPTAARPVPPPWGYIVPPAEGSITPMEPMRR